MTLTDSLLSRAEWWIDETGFLDMPPQSQAVDDANYEWGLFKTAEGEHAYRDELHLQSRAWFDLLIREAILSELEDKADAYAMEHDPRAFGVYK